MPLQAPGVIAIAGSSGLIGSALTTALRAADHRVIRIVRRAPGNADELFWNPATGDFDIDALAGVDAVVNLCGVSVGAQPTDTVRSIIKNARKAVPAA